MAKQSKSELVIQNNRQAFEAIESLLKALKDSGSIIGRTNSTLVLQAKNIPSLILEDAPYMKISFSTCKGRGFTNVFESSGNKDVFFLDFYGMNLDEKPDPWTDVMMNERWPYIEEARAALKALPVLTDEQEAVFSKVKKEISDGIGQFISANREQILAAMFSGSSPNTPVTKQIH